MEKVREIMDRSGVHYSAHLVIAAEVGDLFSDIGLKVLLGHVHLHERVDVI